MGNTRMAAGAIAMDLNVDLYHLLKMVDSEARVIDLRDTPNGSLYHGRVRGQTPTHAVINADGDSLGAGLSPDEAAFNAIVSAFRWEQEQRKQAEAKLRALGDALKAVM